MSRSMHRPVVGVVALVALVAAAAFVWVEVRQEREFRRLVAVGEAALAEGQTFVAIEAFSGAVVLKPGSMLPHLKRGDTYRRRGEFANASRDLLRAAELDETAPQPLELLGDLSAAMGRHQRAADYYSRYLQLDDRAAHVLYKLAVAQVRDGRPERAIDPLLAAIALDDGLVEAHYLLGMSLRSQKRYEEALRALTRAVALNAAFVAAHEELAHLYADLGRPRDQIEQLERIAALEPQRAERLVRVGLMYARIGRQDAAILTLGRAAERFPDAQPVYAALGRVWLTAADVRRDPAAIGKAIEALEGAAGRTDATAETLTLYGRALLLSGQAAAAERALLDAVRRPPVDPQAYRYLEEAATRLGHDSIARAARANYVTLTGAPG